MGVKAMRRTLSQTSRALLTLAVICATLLAVINRSSWTNDLHPIQNDSACTWHPHQLPELRQAGIETGTLCHCVPSPGSFRTKHNSLTRTAPARMKAASQRLLHATARPGTPLLSVILPFYNTKPAWADEAIRCLQNQPIDLEIIIVNDSSTDKKSRQWLRHVQRNHRTFKTPVRVINVPHAGPAAARNIGVAAAKGQLIACLDPDDLINPASLERLVVKLLLAENEVAFTYGAVEHFGAINATCRDAFDARRLLRENFLASFFVMWRDVYLGIGGMDTSFDGYEDYDFWLRLIQFGFRGAYLDEVGLRYRRHFEGRMGKLAFAEDARFEVEHRKLRERNPLLYGKECSPQSQYAPVVAWDSQEASVYDPQRRRRRRSLHRIPMLADRYDPKAKPALVFAVPDMSNDILQSITFLIMHVLRANYHVVVLADLATDKEAERQYAEASDEIFVFSRLADSAAEYRQLFDYIIVSRNIGLVFNSNSRPAYEASKHVRTHYPQVRQVDIVHPCLQLQDSSALRSQSNYDLRFVSSDATRQKIKDVTRQNQLVFIEHPLPAFECEKAQGFSAWQHTQTIDIATKQVMHDEYFRTIQTLLNGRNKQMALADYKTHTFTT